MKDKNSWDKLNINHSVYTTRLSESFKRKKPFTLPEEGKIYSFIPGTVNRVLREVGETVKKGDTLLVLEAMKMKNSITSPVDGVVRAINVKEGDRVPNRFLLVEMG